ncbi:MAG: bifunctional folylpolyglutamate synthase/dihydrofolate synthase [Gemmatimonadales bacterium]|nr:bifunctional folylpolyglutamate synthase/dihydrofolate synthase [Gemmatimonadales bacterium]
MKWSLGPTRALLTRLGHPERQFSSIHIGGTNGKGSVATLVAAALRNRGHRVGLYTSPHLVDLRERMIVNGSPVSEEALVAWTNALHDPIEETGASFFEATTAIAFADFAARGVELAVVEVGLGGRLDSTNVLDPLVSAVTSIALEHTEYLGNSLESIAVEKAGIAKRDRPFVIGERDAGLVRLLQALAREVGALPVVVSPSLEYGEELSLAGPHQRRNAAVARAVLEALPAGCGPTDAQRDAAFATARIPGRFDRRGMWLFDVAHNPSGIDALVAACEAEPLPRPMHALAGVLGDKDWRAMLARLGGLVDRLWVTIPPSAPSDRHWSLVDVGAAVPSATVEQDFDKALADVRVGAASVLVTGSFHTVGDAMARLPGFAPFG